MERRKFIKNTAVSGMTAMGLSGMVSAAMGSTEAKGLATSSNKARFNLKYAPSLSMFSQHVGKDPVEHLKFIADQGFRAAFDLGMVNRPPEQRSEEHTSELQSLMRISYAVFCLQKKKPRQLHN